MYNDKERYYRRILDAISHPTPERHVKVYIYAVLAFLCTILRVMLILCICRFLGDRLKLIVLNLFQAGIQTQCSWLTRRQGTRIKLELTSAIYDKALKRKDLSGVLDRYAIDGKCKEPRQEKERGIAREDDSKVGADIGKIVNLMSGDTTRVSAGPHCTHMRT